MSWPTAETDVARPFAAWMRNLDWEIFPEVELRLSGRADMVGRRQYGTQELYHAVEVKRSFGWSVLNQAIRHTATVHYASVVVPAMKNSAYQTRAAQTVLQQHGIGLYVIGRRRAEWEHWRPSGGRNLNEGVIRLEEEPCSCTKQEREEGWCSGESCKKGYEIKQLEPPKLHRIDDHFLEHYVSLTERHKGKVPGNADADYWTPWRETCHRVEKFVEANPGCTTTELIEGISHHYKTDNSARSSIPQWIRAGKIDVDIEKRSGRLYYYPPEGEEETDEEA